MIEVIPTGKALGAEIRGADLSRGLGPADVRTMLDAWSQHLVLLFRDQFISDPELIGLSRSFGDLDLCPPNATGKQYSAEHPELIIVSNVVVDGEPLGSLGDRELRWHTDMSNHAVPPRPASCMPWKCRRRAASPNSATCTRPRRICPGACGRRSKANGHIRTARTTAPAPLNAR